MQTAIEIDRLTKRFGRVEAVRDLSFAVAPGKVSGFLGPNCAGKSTTLRMLLVGLVPEFGRWAPFGVLPVAAAGLGDTDTGSDDLPGVPVAVAALVAWTAGLLAAAAFLLRRRDLD